MPAKGQYTFNMKKALEDILDKINPEFQKVKGKIKNINYANIETFKTVEHCCVYLGIGKDTWYRHGINKVNEIYNKKDAEWITNAIKRYEAIRSLWWTDAGLSGKVNATAWVFCKKNIDGWKDKQELTTDKDNPININYKVIK